ncbi:hypothetical protein HK098_006223 [Nowakowskiella sp. JEL0407]|nr:hypothetical protein HK098_006223 [Nowakowskiella sp. JEL0407]
MTCTNAAMIISGTGFSSANGKSVGSNIRKSEVLSLTTFQTFTKEEFERYLMENIDVDLANVYACSKWDLLLGQAQLRDGDISKSEFDEDSIRFGMLEEATKVKGIKQKHYQLRLKEELTRQAFLRVFEEKFGRAVEVTIDLEIQKLLSILKSNQACPAKGIPFQSVVGLSLVEKEVKPATYMFDKHIPEWKENKKMKNLPHWIKKGRYHFINYSRTRDHQNGGKFLLDDIEAIRIMTLNAANHLPSFTVDPANAMRPDCIRFGWIQNSTPGAKPQIFSILCSAKIHGRNVCSPLRESDLDSTDFGMVYKKTDGTDLNPTATKTREKFNKVMSKYEHVGSIRLVATCPGIAKKKGYPPPLPIEVDNNDVIIRVDQSRMTNLTSKYTKISNLRKNSIGHFNLQVDLAILRITANQVHMISHCSALASAFAAESNMIYMIRLLWADFFAILLSVLTSPWMQIEKFGLARQKIALKLGSEIRDSGSALLMSMWEHLMEPTENLRTVISPDTLLLTNSKLENALIGLKVRRFLQVNTTDFGAGPDTKFAVPPDDELKLNRLDFFPNIIMLFIELSMCTHLSLRNAAVELLYSIMENEFVVNCTTSANNAGNFGRFEKSCILSIDEIIMVQNRGSHAWRKFFVDITLERIALAAEDPEATKRESSQTFLRSLLSIPGRSFVKLLDQFSSLCLTVRDLPNDDQHLEERMSAILKLMQPIRNSRPEVNIKYAHQLLQIHISAHNFMEARLTLKLYSDILVFHTNLRNLALTEAPIPEFGFHDWHTANERKEILSNYYEKISFDYYKLAAIRNREAGLYERLSQEGNWDTKRFYLPYYRVGFFGMGWTPALRNQQFVYRAGEKMEVISSFTERILNRYVGATIIRNNSAVTDAIKNEVGGKYIQITAVNPEMDPRRLVGPDGPFAAVGKSYGIKIGEGEFGFEDESTPPPPLSLFERDLDPAMFVESDIEVQRAFELLEVIPEHVRAYYQQNDVNLFSYSRPVRKAVEMETDDEEKSSLYQIDSGVNNGDPTARDFLELWIERTVLVTEDKFPNLLKRSPVIKDFVFEISPIKNAVIAVRAKNRQLRELEVTYEELAQNAGVWPPIPRKTVGLQTEINESNNSNSNINVNPFTMAINGAVDAPVNGGLPMYRKAFLSDRFRKSNLDSTAMVEMLEAAVEEQVFSTLHFRPYRLLTIAPNALGEILYRCLSIHEAIVPKELRPLHDNLVMFYKRTFAIEIPKIQQLEIFKTHPVANIKLMKVGTSTSDDGISVSSPSTPSRSSFGNSIRKGGGVGSVDLPRTNSSNNKISSMINQAKLAFRSTSNVANVGTPTKLVAPKKDDETNGTVTPTPMKRSSTGPGREMRRPSGGNAFSSDSEDPPVYPTEEVKSKLHRKITITAGVSSTMERVGSIVTSPTTLVFDKPEVENGTGNGQNSRRSSINIQNDEAGQEAGVLGRRRRPLSAASGSSITAFKSMLEKFEFS